MWMNFNRRFFQKFSTLQNVDTIVVQPKIQSIKKSWAPLLGCETTEIMDLVKKNKIENYTSFIPRKILKKCIRKKRALYLINRDCAKKFCTMISEDLKKNMSYVIENNPGLGFLTQELLNIGAPNIHLYEKNHTFFMEHGPLFNLMNKYKERLTVKELTFTDIWSRAIRDNFHDENLSGCYIDDLPKRNWDDETYAQIILFVPDKMTLSMIIYNFFYETSLFTHGRPVFYLGVNSNIWNVRILFGKT